ncbi:MAG: DUF4252 domain-containing protein [Butyricimonas faecihominis]
MKIKSLLTCMMVSLVTILPLQAQVGKEMKAFRNKDGITVTMLNPSLYSLYKQGDLSLPAEEALKDIKEINVMQVDIKRATPKVVEEISQRITPIVENEAKYTLVRSHRGAYSQEYLYVTQHEERITSLVLWSEDAETLSIVELKGNIQLDNVDEIANALKVKGLDRLAYINTPTDQVASGSDFIKKLEERFGIKRDSIFGKDPFGSFRESFGSMDDMLKKAEEMFRDMGPMFRANQTWVWEVKPTVGSYSGNGKTRIKVNAKNSEVSYVIDGIEYAADSLKNGIPDEIATVNMITSPTNAKKSYVVINTKQKKGQFISYANGVLKYKYNKQEYTLNPEKLEEPALIINNRLTRSFNIDPVQIIQIRPVSELERQLLGAPSAQVIIVTDKMGFFF